MYLSILALFTTPRERRWSDRRDSNSRPLEWKSNTLSTELLSHMAGEKGFEPLTVVPYAFEKNCSLRQPSTHQNDAALPLSYSPIGSLKYGSSLGQKYQPQHQFTVNHPAYQVPDTFIDLCQPLRVSGYLLTELFR